MTAVAVGSICVPLNWWTVASSDERDSCLGAGSKLDRKFLARIEGPQVYRFRIFHIDPSTEQRYIAESERFEQRCSRYIRSLRKQRISRGSAASWNDPAIIADWKEMKRNPCVGVAAAIRNAELGGGRVELQLLRFEEFAINGFRFSGGSLDNTFARRLMENLAILTSDDPGVQIMNEGGSVAAKVFGRRLEAMRHNLIDSAPAPPAGRENVLKGHGFSRAEKGPRRPGL